MSHRPSPFRPACPNARLPGHSAGRSRSDAAARGFSFVELLFAVAVMGIGFIMLAALFPVGLQQTKLTIDETAAASNARGAAAALSQLAQSQTQYITGASIPANSTSVFPATYVGPWPAVGGGPGQVPAGGSRTFPGQVRSLREARNFADAWNPAITLPMPMPAHQMTTADISARRNTIWTQVSAELMSKSNERNATVLLYRRDVTFTATRAGQLEPPTPSDNAQLILINSQVAAQSAYTNRDSATVSPDPVAEIYNLQPRAVGVTISYDTSAGAYVARFSSVRGTTTTPPPSNHVAFPDSGAYDAAVDAAGEGAFVVISDDAITSPGNAGRLNGRLFRLGNYRTDLTPAAFELAPGYGFTVDNGVDGVPHDASVPAGRPGHDKDDVTALGVTGNLPIATGGDGSDLLSSGPAVAYVLGKGFDNLSVTPAAGSTASRYVGVVQDVAAYMTFISVK